MTWPLPPESITLGIDEVHVWRARLDVAAPRLQSLWQTLAPDERKRAERFHFRRDHDSFVVARGLLRIILGRYLNAEPDRLRFRYSRYAKPALTGEFDNEALRFNLSHSDNLALYAVTRGREIGVDLERLRPDFADDKIAEQFFASGEVAALRALPVHAQQEAFFNCWTRKEAFIKARGEGLSLPLDEFEVSLAPGEPAALLSTKGDTREVSRWSLRELIPEPGYVAALAVEGHNWRIRCWRWSDADLDSVCRE